MIGFGKKVSVACREAQADLPESPVDAQRIRRHRSSCEACQRHERALAEIRGAVLAVDQDLDEVARARIEARLGPQLDRLFEVRARGRSPEWEWQRPLVAAAAIAAGVVAVLILRLSPPIHPAIVVRSIDGPKSEAVSPPSLNTPIDHLAVPAEAWVEAEVAGDARVGLLGHGVLAQAPAEEGDVVLELHRGLLLVDVTHRPGRTWQVKCREVRATVIGTRFLVDARQDEQVSVEVARGSVEVIDGDGTPIRVSAGRGWDRRSGERPIDPELYARLEGWGAPRGVPAPAPAELKPAPQETQTASAATPRPSPPVTAEIWYQRAEAAMARNDLTRATRLLEGLVRRYPADPLTASALLELARIAETGGQGGRARDYLTELLARDPDPAIGEAAHHQLCRLTLKGSTPAPALECYIAFRRRFSDSARDREALRAIIGLSEAEGGCSSARRWIEEWLKIYRTDPLTPELRERLQRCRDE